MKLQNLLESSKKESNGTYAAVRFDKESINIVEAFMNDNNIPNPLGPDKIHCTIIYSRKYIEDYPTLGAIDPPWIAKPKEFKIFTSQEGNNCLVLTLSCDKLIERHDYIMENYDATYDFDEYNPHITLSYNCGDVELDQFNSKLDQIDDLKIIEEYSEDLNLSWEKENRK